MRHITFAVKAAVISTVVSAASGAVASTVDSLENPPFFAPVSSSSEDSNPNDFKPHEVTIGVGGTETTVLESVESFFDSSFLIAEPHKTGVAIERAHVSVVYAKGQSSVVDLRPLAIERGYMKAALPVASIAVPLPASGILLCFGLFGLARFVRRAT